MKIYKHETTHTHSVYEKYCGQVALAMMTGYYAYPQYSFADPSLAYSPFADPYGQVQYAHPGYPQSTYTQPSYIQSAFAQPTAQPIPSSRTPIADAILSQLREDNYQVRDAVPKWSPAPQPESAPQAEREKAVNTPAKSSAVADPRYYGLVSKAFTAVESLNGEIRKLQKDEAREIYSPLKSFTASVVADAVYVANAAALAQSTAGVSGKIATVIQALQDGEAAIPVFGDHVEAFCAELADRVRSRMHKDIMSLLSTNAKYMGAASASAIRSLLNQGSKPYEGPDLETDTDLLQQVVDTAVENAKPRSPLGRLAADMSKLESLLVDLDKQAAECSRLVGTGQSTQAVAVAGLRGSQGLRVLRDERRVQGLIGLAQQRERLERVQAAMNQLASAVISSLCDLARSPLRRGQVLMGADECSYVAAVILQSALKGMGVGTTADLVKQAVPELASVPTSKKNYGWTRRLRAGIFTAMDEQDVTEAEVKRVYNMTDADLQTELASNGRARRLVLDSVELKVPLVMYRITPKGQVKSETVTAFPDLTEPQDLYCN